MLIKLLREAMIIQWSNFLVQVQQLAAAGNIPEESREV